MGIGYFVQFVVSILFLFLIPGFILTLILFEKRTLLELIGFSIVLSICVSIVFGLILGFTGFFTLINIWLGLILFSIIMSIFYLLRDKRK